MRILNEEDVEIQEEDVNLELGYLVPDKVFVQHHEAVEYQAEQGHYYPITFYFEDGTSYNIVGDDESDPHVHTNEDGITFTYIAQEGEEEKTVRGTDVKWIVDVPEVKAHEAYDEYEDIQRYKLYTEEQLAQIQEEKEKAQKTEQFLSTGPDRLDNVEINVDDMTMLIADMIGVQYIKRQEIYHAKWCSPTNC